MCNDDPPDIIVRDHCHITGVFRGAAHQSCNLNYRIIPKRWKLPIFFHNLRGYDGQLLIRAVQKRHGSIRVIPTNMEKYLAISIGQVQFLDSLQFTMKSLDNLVGTLDSSDFKYTRAFFPNEEQFHLMTQKGIFPYDFFDNFSKLNYNHFPPREAFYNTLANEECSIKDYLHGELVWNKFNCKTFKDYHDLYLKSDVLLLTDFFEKFRNECINSYGLDAAHYFSAPGMAWDAALKLTEVQLQLFDNEEMYTFLERSIRGGVSQISKRVAIANNENCQDFDPLKPISHLIYLDANNLYGWAMSQSLPTHDFRWLTFEEIANLDIRNISKDAEYGYIYEVDLHYPDNLHDLHNDYPLAPERLTIDESMLSNFQQEKFPASQKKTSVKLSPNLRDKTNYVVHYRNLKFYLEQGLVITKIHKVLSFKQSPWLKPYIDFNTSMRSTSSSAFAKDFYKLMNNAVYGKTNENLRNRVNVEVLTNREKALKRVCKPSFKRSLTIREDLAIMQCSIANLELNKPVYVGFSILDLSKLLMYEFHYNKMLQKYKDNINLCFTDTDSLLYEIITNDIYKDMFDNIDDYDFSDYPMDHYLYNNLHKKEIGKFKDELNGMTLEEYIGLRPKCYSLLYRGEVKNNKIKNKNSTNQKQTAKGTKASVKKALLRHHHYKQSVNNLTTFKVKQNVIKSKLHKIGSYHQNKISLSAFDTKRWILDDGIKTLAYGHVKTKK